MKAILRDDTPYALRIVIAVGAFALAIIGWLEIIGEPHATAAPEGLEIRLAGTI